MRCVRVARRRRPGDAGATPAALVRVVRRPAGGAARAPRPHQRARRHAPTASRSRQGAPARLAARRPCCSHRRRRPTGRWQGHALAIELPPRCAAWLKSAASLGHNPIAAPHAPLDPPPATRCSRHCFACCCAGAHAVPVAEAARRQLELVSAALSAMRRHAHACEGLLLRRGPTEPPPSSVPAPNPTSDAVAAGSADAISQVCAPHAKRPRLATIQRFPVVAG